MYVTRSLSQLRKSPQSLAALPDGPNSGYLVINDEESDKTKFGRLNTFPFPQNKELAFIPYSSCKTIFLIPVLDHPLSFNQYYAIVSHGTHKGKAYTCTTEEDKVTCFSNGDVKSRPLDPHNIYQQFEIVQYQDPRCGKYYAAKSIALDGFAPHILRKSWYALETRTPDFKLGIAQGLDSKLRACPPKFDIPLSRKSSEPRVVGKWYTPCMFVKEGTVRDQVKRSMYYEVTLEQRWEEIFSYQKNTCGYDEELLIDTVLEKEEVLVGGSRSRAAWNEKAVVDGVIWYMSHGPRGERIDVGLRLELIERMKWEQKRGGWIGGEGRQGKINKVTKCKFKKGGGRMKVGCYILVERFNLKRMDGSLVMSYDFKHLHQTKTKWEWEWIDDCVRRVCEN